ncbi:hypothetical protein [Nonomuraea aurantiaca]|uniref:hypothetical protein n=1 Tax=Nonomuraea aurantiaca TaxID=2878562 RepID=UPI001CDA43CC|nr:hypothetical protein [Nonomuraea aurantiaca]MCA2229310.1 hypothetical protein [Nonomuraea aurantiaca]
MSDPGLGRRAATVRLLKVYGPLIEPRTTEFVDRLLRVGELGLAVEELANAMVVRRVPLAAGDAVEFRRLLTGFTFCPDTPPDIADLLLFGQDPPIGYSLYLLGAPDPFEVRAAIAERFPIRPERIGIVIDGEHASGMPDRPSVLITADPASGGETVTFDAGREFADLTGGASELAVAKALCRRLDTNAMLGTHGLTPDEWMLVTAAGGHGIVMVDDDASVEGRWEILFAYEPIKGAPGLG